MSQSKKKLPQKELAFYVIAGILATVGLTFIVFGIIGDHFPGIYEDNWVMASENAWLKNWSHLGYRWWGIILLSLAAFIAVVTLNVTAKESDRDADRALRRAQRLAALNQNPEPEEPKPEEAE